MIFSYQAIEFMTSFDIQNNKKFWIPEFDKNIFKGSQKFINFHLKTLGLWNNTHLQMRKAYTFGS